MPPTAAVARKNRASCCSGMAASPSPISVDARLFGGVERSGEALFLAVVARAFPEARSTDSGRAVTPQQLAVRVFAQQLEQEQILRDDDVAFQAHDLGDMRDLARAVAQT